MNCNVGKKNSKQKQVLLKIKIQLYEIIKDTFVQFGSVRGSAAAALLGLV